MAHYIDATDIATGALCQVEIDDASAEREVRRGLFTMTGAPRGDCPLRARDNYGWFPMRRGA